MCMRGVWGQQRPVTITGRLCVLGARTRCSTAEARAAPACSGCVLIERGRGREERERERASERASERVRERERERESERARLRSVLGGTWTVLAKARRASSSSANWSLSRIPVSPFSSRHTSCTTPATPVKFCFTRTLQLPLPASLPSSSLVSSPRCPSRHSAQDIGPLPLSRRWEASEAMRPQPIGALPIRAQSIMTS